MSNIITQNHQQEDLDRGDSLQRVTRASHGVSFTLRGGILSSRSLKSVLAAGWMGLLSFSSCANPNIFPTAHPLFAGMPTIKNSPSASKALAEAREDFILVLHHQEPVHARLVEAIPHTHSKVYKGNGYLLTAVHEDLVERQKDGPEITFEPSITGGNPYTYDQIDITQI